MNRSRIPCLDGVRAIAIGLVCLAHFTWNQRFLGRDGVYLRLGDIGVRVFFVLSGFLITGLLLREMESTASVSLARFYLRRTMRIFPAFYVFVGVMIAVNTVHGAHLFHGSAMPSLSYSADYLLPGKRVFGHTWSLAVEEQFYLLWPTCLLVLGKRRGLWCAGALLIVCPVLRVISFSLLAQHAGIALQLQNPKFRFDTQADALAMGCLLAGFRETLHRRWWYRGVLASRLFVLVPVLGLAVAEAGRAQAGCSPACLVAGYAVTNIAIALSLDWCLTYPGGVAGSILNATPVATIGVMSYSIYLWQEPFLFVGRSAWWQSAPANLSLALLAAGASYVLVERPLLRLRPRCERWVFARVGRERLGGTPVARRGHAPLVQG